ncbi:MAG: hypothetical protein IJX90_12955 [Blautia sp.]|nr:hypothetical protein [Blautia sp.]
MQEKSHSRKGMLIAFFVFAVIMLAGTWAVSARADTSTASTTVKSGMVKTKEGIRFYKKGEYLKNQWYYFNKKKYYLKADGYAIRNCFAKVDGKYWLFDSNSTLVRPSKTSIVKVASNYCYVNKNGNPAGKGWVTIGTKTYYVYACGYCAKNKTIDGIKLGSNGVADIPADKLTARRLCEKFISKHAGSKKSKRDKFRACFNYVLAYQRYTPGRDPRGYPNKGWQYKAAIDAFKSLKGNCYTFAAVIACIADTLGYNPYVVTIKAGHGFVMIDGKYYDNMGALFGSSSHFSYKVKTKFRY